MQTIEGVKNCLLYIVLLLTGLVATCQSFKKAVLLDEGTMRPIPFATIKVLHKPLGTFTDDKGNFDMEGSPTDTLLISSVGFISKKVTGFPDTIFLQPVIRELPPVVVRQKHFVATHMAGIKAKADFQWGPSGYGEEFAQKINLNLSYNEYCQIKKVTLSAKWFSVNTPALLHIYSVDPSTGLPGDELLSNKYFISKGHFRKEKITIDISSEELYVYDSSIFVSFEWLGHGKTDRMSHQSSTKLNMTNRVAQTLTYSRTLLYLSYDWFPAPQKNGRITNTIFVVEFDKIK